MGRVEALVFLDDSGDPDMEQSAGNSCHGVASIWANHSQFVYRVCYRLTRDRDMALDLRQEVFVRIIDRGDGYRGISSLRSWIYSVARNCCMDFFRRERRQRMDYFNSSELDSLSQPESWTVREVAIPGWQVPSVLEACQPVLRTMLELHYGEGIAYGELSLLLGLSRTAVCKGVRRALESVRGD